MSSRAVCSSLIQFVGVLQPRDILKAVKDVKELFSMANLKHRIPELPESLPLVVLPEFTEQDFCTQLKLPFYEAKTIHMYLLPFRGFARGEHLLAHVQTWLLCVQTSPRTRWPCKVRNRFVHRDRVDGMVCRRRGAASGSYAVRDVQQQDARGGHPALHASVPVRGLCREGLKVPKLPRPQEQRDSRVHALRLRASQRSH
jgi:hypothetical protein